MQFLSEITERQQWRQKKNEKKKGEGENSESFIKAFNFGGSREN